MPGTQAACLSNMLYKSIIHRHLRAAVLAGMICCQYGRFGFVRLAPPALRTAPPHGCQAHFLHGTTHPARALFQRELFVLHIIAPHQNNKTFGRSVANKICRLLLFLFLARAFEIAARTQFFPHFSQSGLPLGLATSYKTVSR